MQTKKELNEGRINLGLDSNVSFTHIRINEMGDLSDIVVVGSPDMIQEKINTNKKTLLRG